MGRLQYFHKNAKGISQLMAFACLTQQLSANPSGDLDMNIRFGNSFDGYLQYQPASSHAKSVHEFVSYLYTKIFPMEYGRAEN
jgi:hypothetical protein